MSDNNGKIAKMSNKITKKQLSEALANMASLPEKKCAEFVDGLLFFVEVSLKSGKQVYLDGITTLSVVTKKARKGINPKTKEPLEISEGQRLKSKTSTTFFKTSLTELLTGDYQKKTRRVKEEA